MKDNKKIIIILAILFFVICISTLLYFNNKKSNINNSNKDIFLYKGYKYKVPAGYIYMGDDNAFILGYKADTTWNVTVNISDYPAKKTVTEVYESMISKYDLSSMKINKKFINDANVLFIEFLKDKSITVAWVTQWGYQYEMFIHYKSNTFDQALLIPVIESLNNPINLNEILKTTTTSYVVQNN